MTSLCIVNQCVFGVLMLALFVTSGPDVPSESLVGCYMDDSADPDMGQPVNDYQLYHNMTRLSCACQCIDEGAPFAGVENGAYCYCNSSFGSYGSSPCCSVPCGGDTSVQCGGNLAVLVINISLVDSSACEVTTLADTTLTSATVSLCPLSSMFEPETTENLNSFTIMTDTTSTPNPTVTMNTETTLITTTLSDYTTDELTTTSATTWLTGSDPDTVTAFDETTDFYSSSTSFLTTRQLTTRGSQSTTPGKPNDALTDIDPCIEDEPVVQESDKIGTYKEHQGTAVGYTCHPGLKFDAGGVSRSAICQNGAWLYIAPLCEEVECPADCMVGGRALKLHETVEVSCPPKQRFQCGMTTMNVTCFANGVMKMTPYSTCGDYCQPAPLLRNAVTVSDPKTREANVTCYDGCYFRDGTQSKMFTCDADGVWIYDEHGCDEHNCPELSPPINGSLSSEDVAYGTVVTAFCLTGFMFPDMSFEKNLECMETTDGGNQWNDTIEDCQEIFCPSWPPVLRNSAPSITSFSCPPYPYASNFVYVCSAGSRFEDGKTTTVVTCAGSGEWQTNVSSCASDRCPEVPQVKLATADSWLATNGSVVRYTCQEGYRARGQASVTCDGQRWSTTDLTCEVIQCPVLRVPHGQPTSNKQSVGSVVGASCDVGYMTESKLTFTCSPGGQWNQTGESCRLVDCLLPPEIPNTHLAPSEAPMSTTFGSNQSYNCMSGFWFTRNVRTAAMTCTAEGKWRMIGKPEYGEIGCQPSSCLPLFFHVLNTTDQIPGAVVNVSCEDGQPLLVKGLPSAMTTVCSRYAKWTPPVPNCLGRRSGTQSPLTITEAEGGPALGIFSVCLVMTACFVPLGIDILNYKGSLSRRNRG